MGFLSSLFQTAERPVSISGPIDMVTSSAALSSNQAPIDALLDKVRAITAGLQPGQPPSPDEEKVLFGVYIAIEYYLINDEPVRAFTKDDLRKRFSPDLLKQLEKYEAEHKAKAEMVQ